MRTHALIVTVLVGAAACNRLTSPSPHATQCNPSAASAQEAQPLFSKPFTGDFPVGNLFDHDKPFVFGDSNGYQITMCGARETNQVDGHDGYDWRMPEGTPLFAVADGLVMFATTSHLRAVNNLRPRTPTPRAGIEPPPRSNVAAGLIGSRLRGLSALC